MPKFQKKAVIIEAVQFDGTMDSATNITEWAKRPDGISAVCGRTRNGDVVSDIRIETLEGTMTARPGDWIIRGVAGEFYPCKPDIFQQTYEPAALTQQNEPLVMRNMGDSEAQFIADGEHLNCPACGGSGHVGDTQQNESKTDQSAEEAAEHWLTNTARNAGSHGVTVDQEAMMRLGYVNGYQAAQQNESEPYTYAYVFDSPYGDGEVIRFSSGKWNGQLPKRAIPLFTHPASRKDHE